MKHDYRQLRKQYPEYVSKEQFYAICHISKRTALNLIQSGLVPCLDSGKQTRRYKIATKDMITYLKKRERYPEKYKAPSQYVHTVPMLFEVRTDVLRRFYEMLLMNYSDVLTAQEASEITGVNAVAVCRWIRSGLLKSFETKGKYNIPKAFLIDYMVSPEYRNKRNKSLKQIDDMGGFIKWQQEQSL